MKYRDRILDVLSESPAAASVRSDLTSRVIGQPEAIDALVGLTEKFESGLYDHTKPIASALLLGPTGSGKTKLTEAFTETLYGDIRHRMKVDCAEFQHSSDIAKLVGSPPGYLGHRETPPLFNNKRIKDLQSDRYPFSLIIFDEIEKASDALWHLLLGVLDKGQITNGYNEEVDLTQTVILMTSNAGSSEMEFALGGGLGFKSHTLRAISPGHTTSTIGVAAAKRKFTPEFINRLDYVIACNSLTEEQTMQVIDLELNNLQARVPIPFVITDEAKKAIFDEGFDPKYNARNVKRVIDNRIQRPLGRVIASKQCKDNEDIHISHTGRQFLFTAVEVL